MPLAPARRGVMASGRHACGPPRDGEVRRPSPHPAGGGAATARRSGGPLSSRCHPLGSPAAARPRRGSGVFVPAALPRRHGVGEAQRPSGRPGQPCGTHVPRTRRRAGPNPRSWAAPCRPRGGAAAAAPPRPWPFGGRGDPVAIAPSEGERRARLQSPSAGRGSSASRQRSRPVVVGGAHPVMCRSGAIPSRAARWRPVRVIHALRVKKEGEAAPAVLLV